MPDYPTLSLYRNKHCDIYYAGLKPGIEPRSNNPQAFVLPLHHFRLEVLLIRGILFLQSIHLYEVASARCLVSILTFL